MKAVRSVAALAAAAVLAYWSGAARAYRPFDGTDTAVIEIELGPVEYLRDEAQRMLFVPDVKVNHGFMPRWEGSLEGDVTRGLTAGIPRTSLVESEALLKSVLREGSLQDKPGPSNRIRRAVARDQ